ncbi:MAG TPA: aminopeptidase P family protein [Bacteroidales bacterium]|jgi:Xaa-Pro aminopeptidase|nr:aminopeptidase P family protein [Bacteroidales bacterium]HNV95502.1 aminopeptidase P family protein [Bacteroidales bacterium]HOU98763.1 aminopeptidase P family protein [Bacteroidales bacterium]
MFEKSKYVERRQKLMSLVKQGVILLLGNKEVSLNYPANTYSFRQDSSFLYFIGLDIPNLAALIDVEKNDVVLYGDDIDIEDVIWMGHLPSIKDLAALSGIEHVKPFAELAKDLETFSSRKIHFTPPYRNANKIYISESLKMPLAKLKENSSVELSKAIALLRSVKDADEIAHLDEIMAFGYEMHVTAMKMAQEGMHEQKIAGAIEGIALQYGARVSFPVILSKHGEILHNHHHNNILKKGDLLLCDAGFESNMGYATDNTRTIPVGGDFSQKQREIYEIVLKANNTAIAMSKPGVFYRDVHLASAKIVAEGLKALGLMKGDIENAVAQGAHALFYPHGLGHMMGLDVHDMEDIGENYVGYDETVQRSDQFGLAYLRLAKKLQPGFVLTVEPGIYFIPALIDMWKAEHKFEQFIDYDKVETYKGFGGIRLEDDILITETGCRIMGNNRIPITPEEVEETVKSACKAK